jgi:DNA polymerase-3 subunit epsilon
LYTKRILEKHWNAYKNEKNAQKQPADKAVKADVQKPKVAEPAKPITNDMLASLQSKFGKK